MPSRPSSSAAALGEAAQAPLRGGVGRDAVHAEQRVDRAHVHDRAAALLPHRREHGADAEVGADRVHLEHAAQHVLARCARSRPCGGWRRCSRARPRGRARARARPRAPSPRGGSRRAARRRRRRRAPSPRPRRPRAARRRARRARPAATKQRAMAAPVPRAAPVTMATLPVKLCIAALPFGAGKLDRRGHVSLGAWTPRSSTRSRPAYDADIHAAHRAAREQSWYATTPVGIIVLRHEDVRAVLHDRRWRELGAAALQMAGISARPALGVVPPDPLQQGGRGARAAAPAGRRRRSRRAASSGCGR